LFLTGGSLFLKAKKEALVKECTVFLETALSRGMDLDVKIGRIRGQILGRVRFERIEVRKPWLPEGHQVIFKAEEIDLSYRFLDFLSKKFDSKIVVVVKNPELHWKPHLGVRKPVFPFLDWMKEWAVTRKENIVIRFENMTLILGDGKRVLRGINISYENSRFEAEIPLSHMAMGALDVSSVFKVEGNFKSNFVGLNDAVKGEIHTEGTVINWKPLPRESRFDFVFSKDFFEILSSDFLGGIEILGKIDFTKDYDIDMSVKAKDFSVANTELFFNAASHPETPLRMDLDLSFRGNPWAPSVNGRARIYGGKIGRLSFKAMDVHVTGVYPTLQLEDSGILLDDGVTMHFADKVLEAKDLFKGKTYEELVAEAQQDTVVWGDWEFSRPKAADEGSDSLAHKGFVDQSGVSLGRFGEQDRGVGPLDSDKEKMEVGFEYRLRSKDSLKVKVREDEEFIGVERKLRF